MTFLFHVKPNEFVYNELFKQAWGKPWGLELKHDNRLSHVNER